MKLTNTDKTPRKEYVIHLHFIHPIQNRTDFFFGCLRAIFDRFPAEVVGTTLRKLWDANAGKGSKVVTRNCTIERVEVLHCKQNKK